MADYKLVIYDEGSYNSYSSAINYNFYLADIGNCIQLHRSYPSSGTDDVIFSFNYTDGYEIELGTIDFDASYPSDATYNVYYSSSNYNDINTMINQINQDTAINFIDIINDDPGDDPDDPGDDPDDPGDDPDDPGDDPGEGPSVNNTHIGNSTVALKKIGNSTVVKEVLNGVTIYQA